MRDRWQQGDSLHRIACLFDRHHSSVRASWLSTATFALQPCVEAAPMPVYNRQSNTQWIGQR